MDYFTKQKLKVLIDRVISADDDLIVEDTHEHGVKTQRDIAEEELNTFIENL